ncbi:hypothetical protein GGI25_000185 [Coemansia spiralis]|uniref:Calcium-activated potassium channel BK alpha subunit domain-containing protein n=2 Tax=Coemansia TaxID=4863 RepID=A0A9W8G7Q2_9FUNG|nr:hypothetical protein BX070DRAFT_227618 [Coemansia spiralis]KAJ1987070.1 hypothetical protein EDC05_006018 [Coemansia umbellata]KAJ2625759.1 hypothetical protein GGI26_000220 [Coemansia sp. RSA 1358]KAJ2680881.1 hypothetical protein GGI25_000185 [Coemansia spiralis]
MVPRTGEQPARLARFNVGSTLRASLARTRQRSTGPALQASQDDVSDYNLDELFREDTPIVVQRANTEALAAARVSALSAQRADAEGQLQAPPTTRQMIGLYLDSSATGRRWDQLDAVLNTLVAVLHVLNTTHIRRGRLSVPQWSLAAEAGLGAMLLLQFVPRYLLAPDPLEYLCSLFSVITLVTGLAPIGVAVLNWADPATHATFMSAGSLVFLFPVIFWRLQPALLRCLVPIKNVYRMSAMTRNVLRVLTTVFTTVLAITVLTHIMVYYQNKDKTGEVQGFDEAFFFIAVSAITGLSSDIEPDTWFTRGVVLFVMFIGIFWLPPRVSEMLSLWRDRSPWPAAFEAEANQAHVLVIGDLEYTALFEFLREFFCEDHGVRTVNTVVVLMSEREPGKEVAELLGDPAYVNRAKFVLGSPTSFAQLARVQAERAQAVFVLSSKAAGAAREDAAKVMVALAVRKYLKTRGQVPIYAQVLAPETILHMEFLAEHVVCVEELRLGLLAKSVMVPGLASMLQLLTTSIPDNTTEPLIRAAAKDRRPWLAEYAESMSHEIYAARLPRFLAGMRFQKAANIVFQRTGATLFALRTAGADGRLLINPVGHELQGNEMGFVLAASSLVSLHIAVLTDDAAVDIEAGADEAAPLIPIAAAGGDARIPGLAGSPLQKHLAATEAQLKAKVPFGMNIMDTVVVSEPTHNSGDSASIASKGGEREGGTKDSPERSGSPKGKQPASHELIDLDDRHELLSPELAGIEIETEAEAEGSASDASDSRPMQRAPLVFNPKTKTGSDADPHAVREKIHTGGQASSPPPGRALDPGALSDDGLPAGLAGHLVVCDTSSAFPCNIIYLVSCIRGAAPSEVTVMADSEAASLQDAPTANPLASLYEQITRSYTSAKPAEPKEQKPQPFLNMLPIVILSPDEPTAAQRRDLERFGSVYIVCGSPLARADLARVRIHTARSAVVLANHEEWLNAASDTETKLSLTGSDTTATATADAPALLAVLNIEALTYDSPGFFMTVEFIHRENMQFVGDLETITINDVYAQAFLRPSFMSGRVLAPVMLDTLVCQAYYNEHVLEILQRLIFSHGNVVHALGMAKLKEAGVTALVYNEQSNEELGSGHVFLVELPARFVGRSYGSLFSHCCFAHSAVPIGLYRATIHHRQPLWYVVPNPKAECVLREDDRVYLISSVRPILQ